MKGALKGNYRAAPTAVARKPKTAQLTLAVAAWIDTACTVSTGRLRVNESSNLLISVSSKAGEDIYATAEVFCSAIGRNVLHFSCVNVPTGDITLNVILL